jgi:hypothetical protein
MITIEKSYEFFIDTLSRLGESKLQLNDDDLAHEIFEELDSEYHSFLHEWTVDRLIDGGLISHSLRQRILTLRENIRPIMEGKHEIILYRNDSDWSELRNEARSILNIITKKEKSIISCIECQSSFFVDSSYMAGMCPECSHHLYGYDNCSHNIKDGRCVRCHWDETVSDYISNLKNKSGN